MIKLVEDVGAPATVIAADIATLELVPQANEWVAYGLTALGYLGGIFRFGGNYVKNLGVASLPLTARHIYERVRMPVARRAGASRLVLQARSNTGGLGRQYEPEFKAAGARAI